MIQIIFFVIIVSFDHCGCVKDAKELYNDVSRRAEESKYWRPVREDVNTIITYLGVTLIQIINLDEKSKVISLSIWLRQIWKNKFLRWDPSKYGGIKSIYLPHSSMWLPDIVLFNNADGKYETQFPNKPILYYNGMVDWISPAIFQSTCDIDVKYFPYDEQTCYLNFGSWTYRKDQVKVQHMNHLEALLERSTLTIGSERWLHLLNVSKKQFFENGAFLTNYYKSGEWDLMQTPTLMSDSNARNPYDTMMFGVRIRRKTLFYNLNLILPMIGLSVLAALSFYLPANSGEKITLCTLILLTITVFFVLMADSVPPTSLVIPIINQYLIISFLLIIASVFSSVIVLNFNYRSSATNRTISRNIQRAFIEFLPKVLFMKRPSNDKMIDNLMKNFKQHNTRTAKVFDLSLKASRKLMKVKFKKCLNKMSVCLSGDDDQSESCELDSLDVSKDTTSARMSQLDEARAIISDIANNYVDEIESNKTQNDWKYIAMVLDRLVLFIFIFICTSVALLTCLQSPVLYDNSLPINQTLYNDSTLNILLFQQL